MSKPTYAIAAAFGVNPLTTPSAGQWVDLTAYVRSASIRRGKDHELSSTGAGELELRLDNTDRRFDPTNTAGPYYPSVRPMTRVRVRATVNAITYDLFQGFVEDWGQTYPPRPIANGGDAEVVVRAVDAFKVLSLHDLTAYSAEVLADEPLGYWRLDDPAGARTARSEGSVIGADLILTNVTPGTASSPFGGGQTSTSFPGTGSGAVPTAITDFDLRGDLTLEWWMLATNALGQNETIIDAGNSAYGVNYPCSVLNGAFVGYRHGGMAKTEIRASVPAGSWHHVAIVRQGASIRIYVDGVLATEDRDNPSIQPLGSYGLLIGAGTNGFNGKLAHLAIYGAALSGNRIAAHYAAAIDRIPQGTASNVIGAVLDSLGWPAGERMLDTGASTIQAVTPSGSALDFLRSLGELTEGGLFFVTGAGVIRFLARDTLLKRVSSSSTWGDGGGSEIPYSDLTPRYDDQDIYTAVRIGISGGPTAVASDATAEGIYGPRILEQSDLLLALEVEAIDRANGLLIRYKTPKYRIEELAVDGAADNTRLADMLGRELGDRITVKRRPPGGGPAISQDVVIEGIRHEIRPPGRHKTAWSLAPVDPGVPYWILGDATYSVLGSTTDLGY